MSDDITHHKCGHGINERILIQRTPVGYMIQVPGPADSFRTRAMAFHKTDEAGTIIVDGVTVEALLAMAIDRIEQTQDPRHEEAQEARSFLLAAMELLHHRLRR